MVTIAPQALHLPVLPACLAGTLKRLLQPGQSMEMSADSSDMDVSPE
jgi:hypothetical protein